MGLDTSFYYRLTNTFQGPGQSLDVKPDGTRRLKMAPTGDYSGQNWMLVGLGSGKYALRTRYLGDCFSLDVINDGTNDKPWLNATGNFSGQSWSLTPWGDGTYKLWNDFTGSGKSLNVRAQSFEPFVGEGDFSGQHWVLTPLTGIGPNAVVPQLDAQNNPIHREGAHNEGASNYNFFLKPEGTIRAVMIFVDFPDLPSGTQTPQSAADSVLGRMEMPFPGLLKRYAAQQFFHDESYGKLTLDVEIRSDLGWRRMPINSSGYDLGIFESQRDYIAHAARLFTPLFGSKVIFAAYQIVYVVPPKDSRSEPPLPKSPAFNAATGSGARSLTGEIRLGVTLGQDVYNFRYITLIHETGHLFDLPDLYSGDQSDKNPALHSKAGCWDIMADTFRAGSFLGWHRHKNGWLDQSRKLYISQSTPGWFVTLSPLSGPCGISMIVLPIDNPLKPSRVFVVELAPPVLGLPGNIPRAASGVLVYTVDATTPDLNQPLVVLPKKAPANESAYTELHKVYGPLCEAAFEVGDQKTFVMENVSLGLEVIQKTGECYNIKITYTR